MSVHDFDIKPDDQDGWADLSQLLADSEGKRIKVRVEVGGSQQRTLTQNAAIHLYTKMLSEALNDAGLDMVTSLEKLEASSLEINWTPEMVKERLWKPAQKAMTGKESTTELDKFEVSEVYEVLNRHLAKTLGLPGVPFPDRWGR